MKQEGFTPIIIIAVILALSVGGILYKTQFSKSTPSSSSNTESLTSTPSATLTPTTSTKPSSTTTSKTATKTPTLTKSSTPNNTSASNPYDLNSATGSVRVMVKAQNGNLGSTPQAELTTISGFKVLDGRSTDRLTAYGPNRTDELRGEILFSTAPPGPYKVRISYSGSWSDQKDVSVSSGQQAYVEFTVAGVTAATTTPKPKPICNVLINPNVDTRTAPFSGSVCVGNLSNPYQNISRELVDYDGNGSWDYDGPSYGCHSYTFTSPGTYTPKAKIVGQGGTVGDESDICQTTVTIN